MDARLKVTSKGQITLRRELLDHLGVKPGDSVVVDLNRSGEATLKPAPRNGIERVFGMLKNEKNIHLSLDDIDEAIRKGWAGER